MQSAFDITGQQGMVLKAPPPPPPPAGMQLAASNEPRLSQQKTTPALGGIRRTMSLPRPCVAHHLPCPAHVAPALMRLAACRALSHTQQLKKALAVQSAHVITQDYLVLSQSLHDVRPCRSLCVPV